MNTNHDGHMPVPDAAFNFRHQVLAETTLAYIAGIVDGEGCISIGVGHTYGRSRKTKHIYMMLRLEVASSNEGLIDFLYNIFGGQRYRGRRPNRKPYFRWSVAAAKAEKVLRAIQPYVFLKRTQVVLALEFASTKTKGGGRGLSLEIRQRRSALRETLMLIKKLDDTKSKPQSAAS